MWKNVWQVETLDYFPLRGALPSPTHMGSMPAAAAAGGERYATSMPDCPTGKLIKPFSVPKTHWLKRVN